MDEKTKCPPEIVKALHWLAELLNAKMTDERCQGYWFVLETYGEIALFRAIRQAARLRHSFPAPAALIDILEGIAGSIEEEAALAWIKVQDAFQRNSASLMARITADDPRIAAGIKALGGSYTMKMSSEPMHWQRQAFIQSFTATHKTRKASGQVLAIAAPDGQNEPTPAEQPR